MVRTNTARPEDTSMKGYRAISRVDEEEEEEQQQQQQQLDAVAGLHAERSPADPSSRPRPPLPSPGPQKVSNSPLQAVEHDPLLTNPQPISPDGRTRSNASYSSFSSATSTITCSPERVSTVLQTEKAMAHQKASCRQSWAAYYGLLTRKRSAPRVWLYLLLAAFTLLAFFALYEDNQDKDEEPLKYSPLQSFHFLENRVRLYEILAESVPDFADPTNKIRVLVPASQRPHRAHSDSEYENWRQASNVLYVMGDFNVADSLVVLTAKPVETRRRMGNKKRVACIDFPVDDDDAATAANVPQCGDSVERAAYALMDVDVYLPKLSSREKVFSGELPSAETLKHEYMVSSAGPIDPDFVESLEPDTLLLSPEPEDAFLPLLDEDVMALLAGKNISVKYSFEVREAFVEARFIKSPGELQFLKFASRMSAKAHKRLEDYLSKKRRISEIEMASYFKDQTVRRKLRLQAYPPIVGAGQHASILHYRTGENTTAGYAPIERNTFVLVDAAGEYHGYASDITRTITRKTHWSKEMKEVYKIVKTVQQSAVDYFAEGRSWSDVVGFATETLVKQLLRHDFIVGDDLELLINSGVHAVFMPHGLGHPVGLDVHDPVPAKYNVPSSAVRGYEKMPAYLQEIISSSPTSSSRASSVKAPSSDFTIAPGFVCTIEPGVYFIPLVFNLVLNDPEGPGQFINWAKINRGGYFELGGVRIEDVIMIDWAGKKEIITRL